MSRRGPVTAFLTLTPVLVFLVLLAFGWQDYARCFGQQGLSFPAALTKAAGEVFHPFGLVGLVPFLGLAGIWHGRDNGRLTLGLWFGLIVLGLWAMLPPSALHDCDRKGMDGAVTLVALVIPGLLACWIATWNSRPRSAEQ